MESSHLSAYSPTVRFSPPKAIPASLLAMASRNVARASALVLPLTYRRFPLASTYSPTTRPSLRRYTEPSPFGLLFVILSPHRLSDRLTTQKWTRGGPRDLQGFRGGITDAATVLGLLWSGRLPGGGR